MNSPDDEIRAHFDDRRAEDAVDAPAFSTMWSDVERRASAPVSRRPNRAVWLGVAAAAALISATLVVRSADRSRQPVAATIADSAEYPSIVSWTSPTDGLLRASQRAGAAPSVFGSVLDGVTAPPASSDSSKKGGL
jgi:hypothetical protein